MGSTVYAHHIYTDWNNSKPVSTLKTETKTATDKPKKENPTAPTLHQQSERVKLGLNYTINLVLPKTDDPAIYDAIFKSLKHNLLDE